MLFEHSNDNRIDFEIAPEDVVVGVGEAFKKQYIVVQFTTDGRETYEFGLTPELARKLMELLDEFVHYS